VPSSAHVRTASAYESVLDGGEHGGGTSLTARMEPTPTHCYLPASSTDSSTNTAPRLDMAMTFRAVHAVYSAEHTLGWFAVERSRSSQDASICFVAGHPLDDGRGRAPSAFCGLAQS
jgi:hypothetical protein